MGNVEGTSMFVSAEQDSEAKPGEKCLCSAPFKDVQPPMPLAEGFEESIIQNRYPIFRGMPDYDFLKHVELEEYTPNDFTVKVVLDGKRLDAAGKGRGDGVDKVLIWRRCIHTSIAINAGTSSSELCKKSFTMCNFVQPWVGAWADEATDDDIVLLITFYGLDDPDRLEICIDNDGVRDASFTRSVKMTKRLAELYQSWLHAHSAPIRAWAGAKCIKEPGAVSNMSTPMDQYFTYDDLWDRLAVLMKEQIGCEVADISDGSFTGESRRPEMCHCKVRSEIDVCRATGEMRRLQVAVDDDGSLAWPAWSRLAILVVHRKPLVAESWYVDQDGNHMSDVVSARRLQELLNAAKNKSALWFSGWGF